MARRLLISLCTIVVLGGCASERIAAPNLFLRKTGPHNGILGQRLEYTISLNNIGSAPANAVTVRDTVPPGMVYVGSTPRGVYDTQSRTVSWNLGTMNAGAGTSLGVTLRAEAKGEHCGAVEVKSAAGMKSTGSSCTLLAGLPQLELTVADTPDPLELGVTTTYTIDVANRGTESATNVRISAVLPPGLSYLSSVGSTAGTLIGDTVRFVSIPVLGAKQNATYRIVARGVEPGEKRFVAQVIADHIEEPLRLEERTRVGTGVRASETPRRDEPVASSYITTKNQIVGLVTVRDVVVRDNVVSGRVVNRSSRPIRDVHLTIQSIWLWNDEFHPGTDDPGRSVVYEVKGRIPPGGSKPFTYESLPEAQRSDGEFKTRVSVAEYSEIP